MARKKPTPKNGPLVYYNNLLYVLPGQRFPPKATLNDSKLQRKLVGALIIFQ